jgi:hypothetical protein
MCSGLLLGPLPEDWPNLGQLPPLHLQIRKRRCFRSWSAVITLRKTEGPTHLRYRVPESFPVSGEPHCCIIDGCDAPSLPLESSQGEKNPFL